MICEMSSNRVGVNGGAARASRSYGRTEPGEDDPDDPGPTIPSPPPWPDPLRSEAYYGLAGEIVDALEPATEADPVGLLITLLTVGWEHRGR